MPSTGSTLTSNKNARSRTFPGRCALVATICLAGLCGAAVWADSAPETNPAVISTPETPTVGGRFVVFDLLPPPPAPPAAPGPNMFPNDVPRPTPLRNRPNPGLCDDRLKSAMSWRACRGRRSSPSRGKNTPWTSQRCCNWLRRRTPQSRWAGRRSGRPWPCSFRPARCCSRR